MARRTKEEAQQTRCHIMSTALDLFCSHGLAKTSLTDIARAAELTRGAIYWHFKNKEELFVSLWEELCQPLSHQLDACVSELEPDPLGKLRTFLKEVLVKICTNPAHQQMFTIMFNLESLEGKPSPCANTCAVSPATSSGIWKPPWAMQCASASCRRAGSTAGRHPAALHPGWLHHQLAALPGAHRSAPGGRLPAGQPVRPDRPANRPGRPSPLSQQGRTLAPLARRRQPLTSFHLLPSLWRPGAKLAQVCYSHAPEIELRPPNQGACHVPFILLLPSGLH